MSETQGRDWLDMKPAHFDARLLPRKHRKPDPGALFCVADLMPATPTGRAASETDGQPDLFSDTSG